MNNYNTENKGRKLYVAYKCHDVKTHKFYCFHGAIFSGVRLSLLNVVEAISLIIFVPFFKDLPSVFALLLIFMFQCCVTEDVLITLL